MGISDWIGICNVIATVVAVTTAPIIALRVSSKFQERSNTRQQQLRLLSTLISLRHQPLSPESFRALNLIDAVFVDAPAVREAWSKYFSALNDTSLGAGPGFAIREEKRRELMMAMIEHLGLKSKISTADLLRTYAPASIIEAEYLAVWERIKRRADLRAEFIARGIGFPDFQPPIYPAPPQKEATPSGNGLDASQPRQGERL